MPDWIDRLHTALVAVPTRAWLAVLAALVLQRLARRLGMWAYAMLALPGTLAHELAHYGVAWVLRGDPRLPTLWPERNAQGWRLGSVAFRAPWWRAGPIALAPLMLLPASLAWIAWLVADARGAWLALHAWIAGTLLSAALPSRTDLRIAAPSLLVLGVALVAYALWRVHAA
ncbi:hypothetical protein [Cognatilysobacter segetis]|uniref:hypothetical protein n=1 Tax=Cognatilysobacter segetis TaxID=2492394 RepID=UPI00105BC41F|nr:hypothetical protein [Lysobacter segetis]